MFDEAVKGAYSREAMTRQNKAITKAPMAARAKNYHLIFCIPSSYDLDKYFRNHRARLWCHVQRRGEVIAHRPSRNIYTRDVFWQRRFRHRFGPVEGAAWDDYERRKMDYIKQALREDTEEKSDEGDEQTQAAQDQAIAEEVAANDEYWTAKGYCRSGKVAIAYRFSHNKVRHISRLARAIRAE